MTKELATDEHLLTAANALMKKAEREIAALKASSRSEEHNPQRIWSGLKSNIIRAAKKRMRDINCSRDRKNKELSANRDSAKARLESALASPEKEAARGELRRAETAIQKAQDTQHKSTFERRDARTWAEAETMSKSWFRWTKDNKPRDTVVALQRPGSTPPDYVHDSKTMANIAGDYHNMIQERDLEVDADARANATERVLSNISADFRELGDDGLELEICAPDVRESLISAKNGSASGVDGIIYEFWKALLKKHDNMTAGQDEWADLPQILADVYADVEKFGVDETTGFADGWLCPLYKKGDRTLIENYRPITLLNTDYKIYSKALALKLARVAPQLIHESQVGFVRGRSISNLTKITTLILDYAEAYEQNGAIVALDQEKAYDRIRHDYLLATLRRFKLPERLVRAVEHLYAHAYTAVMINGHMSERYKVTRGVRQGDPLSCLLFNLAIEPLAASLRSSNLQGFQIEGLKERLIATLYADDTTVYLSADDDFADLTSILDLWCLASGAKFNVSKTEIIPLGPKAYREGLIDSRKLREEGSTFPENLRIAKDGETTRILGTWPGNAVVMAGAWTKILERVQNTLDRWSEHHPTLNGRAVLTRTLIGGITQYLTAAQGMPKSVEKQIDKMVMDFMWNGAKRHPVNMYTLRGQKDSGGLEIFCAADRNDAQYITWLGQYLSAPSVRPIWAYIADQLFRAAMTTESARMIPASSATNPFTQSWKMNERKLPLILKQMVRVARTYQMVLDAPLIPDLIKENMCVWAHPAMLNPGQRVRRPWTARCLKKHHAVVTVEDLEEIAEIDVSDHEDNSDCECDNCCTDRAEGCRHPHRCQAMAAELLGGITDKWNTSEAHPHENLDMWDAFDDSRHEALANGEALVFDKRAIVPQRTEETARIFVNAIGMEPGSAGEILAREAGVKRDEPAPFQQIQVIVCAGMTMDGTGDATGAFAICFPDGELENTSHTCRGPDQTYLGALAEGIVHALGKVPGKADIHFILTCRAIIYSLTIALERHERAGWLDAGPAGQEVRKVAAAIRARTGEVSFTHIEKKRRKEWPRVKETQELATSLAVLDDPATFVPPPSATFDWPGVSVEGITQRMAQRAIRICHARTHPERRVTRANMDQIKSDINEHCGYTPTSSQIWRGLRSKDLSRQARNFLWKAVHGAHKIGEYFKKMPSPWKEMATCPTCGVTESMEHVLLDCPDSKQEIIWGLVGEIFKIRRMDAGVSMGTILGCANVRLPGGLAGRDLSRERAYRIVVSESAFLAWKIRCEKRIEHAEDPDWSLSLQEVEARWKKIIGGREWRDKYLAESRTRYPPGSRQGHKVWATWRDLTDPMGESILQVYYELGVLVGSGGRKSGVG